MVETAGTHLNGSIGILRVFGNGIGLAPLVMALV